MNTASVNVIQMEPIDRCYILYVKLNLKMLLR